METENKTLIEQSYIARKSSFFGLFHHLVYTPTNSRITDYSRFYGHIVRDEMRDLFSRRTTSSRSVCLNSLPTKRRLTETCWSRVTYPPTNSLFLCGCISMSRLTTAR